MVPLEDVMVPDHSPLLRGWMLIVSGEEPIERKTNESPSPEPVMITVLP